MPIYKKKYKSINILYKYITFYTYALHIYKSKYKPINILYKYITFYIDI